MRRVPPFLVVLAACRLDYFIQGKERNPTPDGTDETDLPIDSDTTPLDSDVDTSTPAVTYPPAPQAMYASLASTLYTVDPVSGAATPVGPFLDGTSAVKIVDLAVDLGGTLYAGGEPRETGSTLWRVDPTSGALTGVCEVDVQLKAMTFLADGRLVAGGDHDLSVVDLANGCAVSALYARDDWKTSGDIVGVPDGRLYWAILGASGGSADRLAVLDPAALDDPGRTFLVGSLRTGVSGGFQEVFGLAYDQAEDALYGFSSQGRTLRVDPGTARTQEIQHDPDLSWSGATTNPVAWGP